MERLFTLKAFTNTVGLLRITSCTHDQKTLFSGYNFHHSILKNEKLQYILMQK